MENGFFGKKIVIGITGGIACYKTLDLIKELRSRNAEVHIIMTEHAKSLADIKDFEKASGNEVNSSLFHKNINYAAYIKKNKPIKHISLADVADIFLVCPATANVIGKIANGIADDLLTTSIMATAAPVLICPAMNVKMWKNPIVQENVSKLRKLDYHFVEPEYGDLACGYKGVGRLANLSRVCESIGSLLLQRSQLKGMKILVTAGATYEEIDPVRVITNKSSGKMGTAIGEQAFLRGADVYLLRGQNSALPRYHFKEEIFTTADDLFDKIKSRIKDAEVVIHCAAVSDFTVEKKDEKIKSGKELMLELAPATKILEKLKRLNPKIMLIGFKAEYNVAEKELAKRAFDILEKSDADFIVANDVSKKNAGFDVDTNEVLIVGKNSKVIKVPLGNKKEIASKILDLVK